MKTLKYTILLVLLVGLTSCEKTHIDETENPNVKTFIKLLKSSQYDSLTLPEFTYKDIAGLLKYRNEDQLITNFPCNPVSSYWQSECQLGVYVLWTIESIRAVSINSQYLIMGFPSQNPILARRDANELSLVFDDESHAIAAEAYYDWWESHKNKDFDDFKNIDPLAKTDYRWH